MLKLIPMPNPFKLALSSYSMTDTGKALIGSTIASAAIEAYQNSQQQQQYQQQAPQQLSPLEETWSFYGKTMQLLENNPQMKASWNNLPKEVKEQRLIELYCKKGNGHLVPYLQKHIFPTIKDSDLLQKLRPPVL